MSQEDEEQMLYFSTPLPSTCLRHNLRFSFAEQFQKEGRILTFAFMYESKCENVTSVTIVIFL